MTGSDGYRRSWLWWAAYSVDLGELSREADRVLRTGAPINASYRRLRNELAAAGFTRKCAVCGKRWPVTSSRDDKTYCGGACRTSAYAQRKAARDAVAAAPPAQPVERARVVRWGGDGRGGQR